MREGDGRESDFSPMDGKIFPSVEMGGGWSGKVRHMLWNCGERAVELVGRIVVELVGRIVVEMADLCGGNEETHEVEMGRGFFLRHHIQRALKVRNFKEKLLL